MIAQKPSSKLDAQRISISIIKKLRKAGHLAFWAGGCVRDILLDKQPSDYDIVTSAKPEEIEKILSHTISIGKKFGVILAVENNHHFEIATFRSDAGYSDGRRPDAILFTNPKEDAKRRDFTINGMFYDPLNRKLPKNITQDAEIKKIKGGLVIDYVEGLYDLRHKIIRFIGNPTERIQEDNLRILRAIRFKNTLGFQLAPQTLKAIFKNAYLVWNISAERIREELNKMLKHPSRAQSIEDLSASGVLKYLLPEVENLKEVPQPKVYHKEGDVFTHTLACLKALPKKAPLFLIWATLLHDTGKPHTLKMAERIRFDGHVKKSLEIVGEVGQRLRFPKWEQQMIAWLVEYHMILGDIPKMRRGKKLRWLLDPRFKYLLALHRADALGSVPMDLSLYEKIKKMYLEAKKIPKPSKKLISGNDIMKKFNIKQGPKVGELLAKVQEAQLEGQIKTKKEAIIFLRNILKK